MIIIVNLDLIYIDRLLFEIFYQLIGLLHQFNFILKTFVFIFFMAIIDFKTIF
jgi:hypothetical protein